MELGFEMSRSCEGKIAERRRAMIAVITISGIAFVTALARWLLSSRLAAAQRASVVLKLDRGFA